MERYILAYDSVLSFHTALASPSGRGTSRREGERDVQTVREGTQFVEGVGAVVPLSSVLCYIMHIYEINNGNRC